jgi:hypothetical protein
MKPYIGVGLSVGVLAGLWTQVSGDLGLITWVAFVAWACFFAAGGGATGFFKGLSAIGVGIAALAMCLQAGWAPLSFIPGAFAGTAVFFGTQLSFWPTTVSLIIGAALGWLSAFFGDRIQALVTKPRTASPTDEPTSPVRTA